MRKLNREQMLALSFLTTEQIVESQGKPLDGRLLAARYHRLLRLAEGEVDEEILQNPVFNPGSVAEFDEAWRDEVAKIVESHVGSLKNSYGAIDRESFRIAQEMWDVLREPLVPQGEMGSGKGSLMGPEQPRTVQETIVSGTFDRKDGFLRISYGDWPARDALLWNLTRQIIEVERKIALYSRTH